MIRDFLDSSQVLASFAKFSTHFFKLSKAFFRKLNHYFPNFFTFFSMIIFQIDLIFSLKNSKSPRDLRIFFRTEMSKFLRRFRLKNSHFGRISGIFSEFVKIEKFTWWWHTIFSILDPKMSVFLPENRFFALFTK